VPLRGLAGEARAVSSGALGLQTLLALAPAIRSVAGGQAVHIPTMTALPNPSTLALDTTIRHALVHLSQVLGFTGSCVLLCDERTSALVLHSTQGLSAQQQRDLAVLSEPGALAERVLISGRADFASSFEQRALVSDGHWLGLPLLGAETALGVLLLLWPGRGEDVAEILPVIESVGRGLGLAVQNARHFHRQQRRAEHLQLVSELGRRLTAILEPEVLLQAMVEQIQRTFGYFYVGVSLVENDSLVIKAEAGRPRADGEANTHPYHGADEIVLPLGAGSISGLVAATGKARIFPDVTQEPNYFWLPEMGPVRSALVVPLHFEDQVMGALDLESDRLNDFDEDDLLLAEVLAAQAAVAITNARLYYQARRRTQEVEGLLDTAQDINSELHLTLLLERVTQRALEITGAEGALVGHVEDGEMVYQTIRTPRAWVPYKTRFRLNEGWLGQAARRRQPYLTNDAPNDPYVMRDFAATYQIHAALSVPVLNRRGILLGAILVFNSTPGRYFGEDDVRVLTALANQAAIAIENARLYELEREKVEALQELEHLKSDFLSGVSHDLRTPLTALRTASQAFPAAGPLTPLQQQLIDNIQRNTERMITLVNDLLEMAKLQSGRLRLNYQRVRLVHLIDELVSELDPLLSERGVRAEVVAGDPALAITADPRRLHQVLLNLLTNACRFSPAGGTITITAAASEDGTTISVRDEGPGIPVAEQGRIFDRFYRLDSGGSGGLGLAIARSLVALHSGTLSVESTPGAGASFHVWLPREVPDAYRDH